MATVNRGQGHPTTAPSSNIYQILEQLEAVVQDSSRRVPFVDRVLVDRHELLSLIEDLRTALPRDLLEARRVLQERQKIITEAQLEAERILATAKERAQYIMSEQGILNETKARCEEMLRQAKEQKQRAISEANRYTREVLEQAEAALRNTANHLQDVRERLGQ